MTKERSDLPSQGKFARSEIFMLKLIFFIERVKIASRRIKIGLIFSIWPIHFGACRLKLSIQKLYFWFGPLFRILKYVE
jgi:hypothetical protein